MHRPNTVRRDILDTLVTARFEQAPTELKSWYGERKLRKQLAESLKEDVARIESGSLAELFAYHCPIAGATESDYRNRWQRITGLGWSLSGIRFRSLDLNRPFVTVVASQELPANQQVLAAASKQLRDEFQVFEPKHVRFLLPPHHPLQPTGREQFWEKRFLAAPIRRLLERPLPANYERTEVRQSIDTSNYPAYRLAYEELLRTSPQHSEYTRLESEEDLAELAQAGTLFDILVDGKWAGIVAVDKECEEGLKGYRVVEFLLDGEFRGKGLGTAVQRRVAEQLGRERGPQVLFGTIDARNQAAIRAASGVGRADIGGYFWSAIGKPTPNLYSHHRGSSK